MKSKRKCYENPTCTLWDYCPAGTKNLFADHCPLKKVCSPRLKCYKECKASPNDPNIKLPCRIEFDNRIARVIIAEVLRRARAEQPKRKK